MEVVLNGETMTGTDNLGSLGSLLDTIQPTFPKGHIVSYLFVDGQEVLQNNADALRDLDLNPVNEVRIQTASLRAELGRALVDLRQFIDEVIPSLEDAAFQVRLGNVAPASDMFSTCFEGIGLALRNMQEIYSAMPRVGVSPNDTEIGLFTSLDGASLDKIMTEYQTQNWRSVGELVRDDLVPVLRTWQPVFNQTSERLNATPTA